MTEICQECYEATKQVIANDPRFLRDAIESAIEAGDFDEAVRRRGRAIRRA